MTGKFLTDDTMAELEASGTLNEYRDEDGNLDGIQLYLSDDRSFSDLLLDWSLALSDASGKTYDAQGFLSSIGLKDAISDDDWTALLSGESAPSDKLARHMVKYLPPDLGVTAQRFLSQAAFARQQKPYHILNPVIQAAPEPKQAKPDAPPPPVSATPLQAVKLGGVHHGDSTNSPFYRALTERLRGLTEGRTEYQHLTRYEALHQYLGVVARAVGVDPWALQGIAPIPADMEPEDVTQRLTELLFGRDNESEEAARFGNMAYDFFALSKYRNTMDLVLAANDGINKPFGQVMTMLRDRVDTPRKTIAKALGVTEAKLAAWETGRTAPPDVQTISAWLVALSISAGHSAHKALHQMASITPHRTTSLKPEVRKYWQQKVHGAEFGPALTGIEHLAAFTDAMLAQQLNEENERSLQPRKTPYTAREIWRWRYASLAPEGYDVQMLERALPALLNSYPAWLQKQGGHIVALAHDAAEAAPRTPAGQSEALTHARRHGSFGELLKVYLARDGVTYDRFYTLLNPDNKPSHHNVSTWISGQTSPDPSTIGRMATVLKLNADEKQRLVNYHREPHLFAATVAMDTAIVRLSLPPLLRALRINHFTAEGRPTSMQHMARVLGVEPATIKRWELGLTIPSDAQLESWLSETCAAPDLHAIVHHAYKNSRAAHAASIEHERTIEVSKDISTALASDAPDAFGPLLRAWRESKQWTHKRAQQESGIASTTISAFENGKPYHETSKLRAYMTMLGMPENQQKQVIGSMSSLSIGLPEKQRTLAALLEGDPLPFRQIIQLYRQIAPQPDGTYGVSTSEAPSLLKQRGLSISQSTLSRWESGKDKPGDIGLLRSYLTFLQVPAAQQEHICDSLNASRIDRDSLEAQLKEAMASVDPTSFGRALSCKRKLAAHADGQVGLSTEALAEHIAASEGRTVISETAIRSWEKGTPPTDVSTVRTVLKALGFDEAEQQALIQKVIHLQNDAAVDVPAQQDIIRQGRALAAALKQDEGGKLPLEKTWPGTMIAACRQLYRHPDGRIGMTQTELAQAMAQKGNPLPQSEISAWERGEVIPTNHDTLQTLLQVLQVPDADGNAIWWLCCALRHHVQEVRQAQAAPDPLERSNAGGELLCAGRILCPRTDGGIGFTRREAAQLIKTASGIAIDEGQLYALEKEGYKAIVVNGERLPVASLVEHFAAAYGFDDKKTNQLREWAAEPAIDWEAIRQGHMQAAAQARDSRDPESFADILKSYRLAFLHENGVVGLTQKEAAALLHSGELAESTVLDWENCNHIPDPDHNGPLGAYMNALHIPDEVQREIISKIHSHRSRHDGRQNFWRAHHPQAELPDHTVTDSAPQGVVKNPAAEIKRA